MVAALTATIIAPVKAGPAPETLVSAANATLPSIALPDLLDPKGQPVLVAPVAPEAPETPDADVQNETSDAAPAVKPAGDLASMVAELRAPEAGSRELDCLATGIYFESKGEPLAGQLAVGRVIANRASSGGRFPSTYCGVLFQRGQFSFVRGHSWPTINKQGRQWQTAVAIAKIVDQDLKDSAAANALYFHARRVHPGWRLKQVASIGNHVFYR